jgi:hypothetical protein
LWKKDEKFFPVGNNCFNAKYIYHFIGNIPWGADTIFFLHKQQEKVYTPPPRLKKFNIQFHSLPFWHTIERIKFNPISSLFNIARNIDALHILG